MGLYLCDKDVIFKYLFEKDVALKYFGCRTKETGENRSVGCWSALKLIFLFDHPKFGCTIQANGKYRIALYFRISGSPTGLMASDDNKKTWFKKQEWNAPFSQHVVRLLLWAYGCSVCYFSFQVFIAAFCKHCFDRVIKLEIVK